MARILSILVLVVALLAAIDVLKTVRETEKRILWLLVIILLPLIGSLLWYLVSRRIIKL
jgi:hypothetical protein